MMKGIECAFEGKLISAELRTSNAGREWLYATADVPSKDGTQRVRVAAFFGHINEIAQLPMNTEIYVEGKIRIYSDMLSVVASVIQPFAQIGQRKPKKKRTPKAKDQTSDYQRPIDFNDELPI